MRTGRPRGPGKALPNVGGVAPHLFEGFPGPPEPARPQKRTQTNLARDCLRVPRKSSIWGSGRPRRPQGPKTMCMFEVWPAPGAQKTLEISGGLHPQHFGKLSRTPGASQTSEMHTKKSGQSTTYYNPWWPFGRARKHVFYKPARNPGTP